MDSSSSIIKIIFDIACTSKGSVTYKGGVSVELEKEFAFLLYHDFMNVLFPVSFPPMAPADSQYWLSHSAAPAFLPVPAYIPHRLFSWPPALRHILPAELLW